MGTRRFWIPFTLLLALIATVAYGVTVNGELVRAQFELLAADPADLEGRVYFNTASNTVRFYDGSAWGDINAAATSLSQYNVDVGDSGGARTATNTNLLGNVTAKTGSFDFVDGDVSTGSDTITETSHGLVSGDTVYLTTTVALPTGLSASTQYFVIRNDANTIRLATTLAKAGSAGASDDVDITAAAGGGTHTLHYGGFNVGRTKWQYKSLATSISTSTDPVTELGVANLTVGRAYRLSMAAVFQQTGTSATESGNLLAVHNGATLLHVTHRNDAETDTSYSSGFASRVFVAAATTVTFDYNLTGTGQLRGDDTAGLGSTFVVVEELPTHIQTSEW